MGYRSALLSPGRAQLPEYSLLVLQYVDHGGDIFHAGIGGDGVCRRSDVAPVATEHVDQPPHLILGFLHRAIRQ